MAASRESAAASDSDGAIDRVEFYRGSTLIGTARTPPYGFQWTDAVQGSHVLTAKAIDNLGGTATSLPATVTVKSNETITYLHNDFLGSAIGATDANGAVLWRESYQPYGERIRKESAASGNRQFYTGKPDDTDIGLSYFGARYYDPVVGRFMGVDPVGFNTNNIHSFNRYAYGNNNPYKFVDPDGRTSVPAILLGLGTVLYVGSTLQSQETRNQQTHTLTRIFSSLKNPFRSESADQSGNTTNSTNPADVLAPDGVPVGENITGAKPGVQTVSPNDLTGIIDRLKGGGATLDATSRYPGDWYKLPNGQGGFGIRESKDNGRTVDVNIPSVPDVTKVHER